MNSILQRGELPSVFEIPKLQTILKANDEEG
jgi:hypothetical protein